MSRSKDASTVPAIELAELPYDFQFSKYLGPAGKNNRLILLHKGRALRPTHLVALALNEICRQLCQGAFYCMPGREKRRPYACDLIFTNERWGTRGNRGWDASTHLEKLELT
jgi:hypothetical protein